MWLNQGRGNQQAQASNATGAASGQELNISDDSGTDQDDEKPAMAVSAPTQAIAKKWLASLRLSGPRHRDQRGGLSDDESSSDNDQNDNVIPVSQPTRRIAKLWLNNIRQTNQQQTSISAAQVSSDEDSSDSGSESGRPNRPGNSVSQLARLADSTRRIMTLWLGNVRN